MTCQLSEQPLGPFQEVWTSWDEVHDAMLDKPLSHFRRAAEVQFEEMEGHLLHGDDKKAAREFVDLISIALNGLRWLGYAPEDVAELVRDRAEDRMKGRGGEILDKYEKMYGI